MRVLFVLRDDACLYGLVHDGVHDGPKSFESGDVSDSYGHLYVHVGEPFCGDAGERTIDLCIECTTVIGFYSCGDHDKGHVHVLLSLFEEGRGVLFGGDSDFGTQTGSNSNSNVGSLVENLKELLSLHLVELATVGGGALDGGVRRISAEDPHAVDGLCLDEELDGVVLPRARVLELAPDVSVLKQVKGRGGFVLSDQGFVALQLPRLEARGQSGDLFLRQGVEHFAVLQQRLARRGLRFRHGRAGRR